MARPLAEPRRIGRALADTKHGRDNPIARYFPLHVALDAPDLSINGLTKTRGALCYCIQHRLNIGWRTADYAQNLTRRSLLLQRLGEIAGSGPGIP